MTREQSLELLLSLVKKIASTCQLMLGHTEGSHAAMTDVLSLKPERQIE